MQVCAVHLCVHTQRPEENFWHFIINFYLITLIKLLSQNHKLTVLASLTKQLASPGDLLIHPSPSAGVTGTVSHVWDFTPVLRTQTQSKCCPHPAISPALWWLVLIDSVIGSGINAEMHLWVGLWAHFQGLLTELGLVSPRVGTPLAAQIEGVWGKK